MIAARRILIMLANIAVYLGTFYGAMLIHDNLLVQLEAYNNLRADNPTMWLISVLTIGYVLLYAAVEAKRAIFRTPGLFRAARFERFNPALLGPLTAIGLACTTFFICMVKLSYLQRHFPALDGYVDGFMGQYFIITIIGVAVVGAVYEETLFRGLILSEMWNARIGHATALILHALLYAYFQPSVPISFVAFFLAILYTLLYRRIQSVWATIYVAAMLNALLVTARKTGIYESIGTWNDAVLHAGAVVSLSVIGAMLFVIHRPSLAAKRELKPHAILPS